MKNYTVKCYYDEGDVLITYSTEIVAASKVHAIQYMKERYPNATEYKATIRP